MNIDTIASLADKKIDLSDGILSDFKKTHLALFRQKGMKEIILDSYKFTNLNSFFDSLQYNPENFEGDISKISSSELPTITFQDGDFLSSDNLPDGILIRRIHSHFHEIKDLFKEANALSHLHHAMMNDGIIVEVEKNCTVKTPLRILNIQTKSTIATSTHLIVAHPHSKLTVIEETRAVPVVSHAMVSETYIQAHAGSQIEHIAIGIETKDGLLHSSVFADVEKDATVRSIMLTASGKMNRMNLTLNLNASGAHGETYALFLTSGTEHSDINTEINHKFADTTSSQIAKGILDGDSKGVFTGKIHIFPKAQRVVSGQLNKNLLLSRKAQVHSQPQLEIFADDVKCSHGSTTGQMSDDEVFYFQARGIPADKARNLLAYGFGIEVVQKIQNHKAQEHVASIIKEKLQEKFSLGGAL